jgi:tRNA G18 (ribose-2'-O)-methylase SpoU
MKKPAPNPSRSHSARPHRAPVRPATDWLSGLHSVHEALRAGRRRVDRLLVRDVGRHGEQDTLVELARARGIPVEAVDDKTPIGSQARKSEPGCAQVGRRSR